jgi:hypothetical protein
MESHWAGRDANTFFSTFVPVSVRPKGCYQVRESRNHAPSRAGALLDRRMRARDTRMWKKTAWAEGKISTLSCLAAMEQKSNLDG